LDHLPPGSRVTHKKKKKKKKKKKPLPSEHDTYKTVKTRFWP